MTSLEEFINEGINRSDYLYKVSSYFRQIVENWCLIRYCTLCEQSHNYKVPPRTKIHWMSELQAMMLNISNLPEKCPDIDDIILNVYTKNKIKSSYDVLFKIKQKFNKENIKDKDGLVEQSANDFFDFGFKDTLSIVLKKRTKQDIINQLIRGYVNTI